MTTTTKTKKTAIMLQHISQDRPGLQTAFQDAAATVTLGMAQELGLSQGPSLSHQFLLLMYDLVLSLSTEYILLGLHILSALVPRPRLHVLEAQDLSLQARSRASMQVHQALLVVQGLQTLLPQGPKP
ncbi:hypothetical protein FVE85_9523 [Porphyridium purpureum]|uniref:Uncharacterized protein n=1 Tax=Porphyridium purpureum TaxID=35688 RepID=A0A5J4YJ10_PORPP|nr:hypothetical protein FVE85_9523 [Porphyridium purpureum]|eukprot:POR1320..scf261_15